MRRRARLRLPRSRAGKLLFLLILLAMAAYRVWRPAATRLPSPAAAPPAAAEPLAPCDQIPGCWRGAVSRVIDGDTIDIGPRRIRLVLVDAPERQSDRGPAATALLRELCPAGATATVLEDSLQPQDDYGRMLALVWCGEDRGRSAASVNELLIRSGRASLYRRFCRQSRFGTEPWARELGCR